MELIPQKELGFVVFVVTIFLLGQKLESEPTEDKRTLRDFISRVPHMNRLQWNESDPVCSWIGVTCDESESFVTAVRLPGVGFVGPIPANTLSRLTGLRVLSLRSNGLSGEIPYDFINLTFMRNLYLQNNQLSGGFPPFLTRMNRLVRLDISSNNLTGSIPFEINDLTHLTGLLLQNNQFNGTLPTGVPSQLSDFNVSNNGLNGSIPKSLARFTLQSFQGNPGLCGSPLAQCRTFFPSAESPVSAGIKPPRGKSRKLSLAAIAAISVGAGLLLLLLLILLLGCLVFLRKRRNQSSEQRPVTAGTAPPVDAGASSSKDITGASLEGERNKLVFLAAGGFSFDLEDLLRASAEVLGKGTLGTSYKAVLEEGTTVVVKRLRDVNVAKNDFENQIQILGKIKHPNLVSLRAYYYSKDEKLLVCDYFPDGSLSAMLHGGGGMAAMDWESRKSVARGAARGLAYLHVSDLVHGNVKSSNVLLHSRGGAYETRLVDFGVSALFPSSEPVKRVVEYRAPETMETRKMTKSSDVYSLGVLLLELLTGKSPVIQSAGEAVDLPRWVRSVVREEWTAEVFDVEIIRSSPTVEEEMVEMLQIAMACVALVPDQRLRMAEVLRLIDAVGGGGDGGAGHNDDDDLRPSDEPSSDGHTPAGTA